MKNITEHHANVLMQEIRRLSRILLSTNDAHSENLERLKSELLHQKEKADKAKSKATSFEKLLDSYRKREAEVHAAFVKARGIASNHSDFNTSDEKNEFKCFFKIWNDLSAAKKDLEKMKASHSIVISNYRNEVSLLKDTIITLQTVIADRDKELIKTKSELEGVISKLNKVINSVKENNSSSYLSLKKYQRVIKGLSKKIDNQTRIIAEQEAKIISRDELIANSLAREEQLKSVLVNLTVKNHNSHIANDALADVLDLSDFKGRLTSHDKHKLELDESNMNNLQNRESHSRFPKYQGTARHLMAASFVGLCIISSAWLINIYPHPNQNAYEQVSIQDSTDTQNRDIDEAITANNAIAENRSSFTSLDYSGVTAGPDGSIRRASKSKLVDQVIQTSNGNRYFSLPRFLLDESVSLAQSQEDVIAPSSIDSSLIDSSLRTGVGVSSTSNGTEISSEEHLLKLLNKGVVSDATQRDLAILSTQQPKPAVSLSAAKKYRSLVGDSAADEAEIISYYGEILEYSRQQRDERRGFIPHSTGKGLRFGTPRQPRSERVDSYVRGSRPTPQEILELRAAKDQEDRAYSVNPIVEQIVDTIDFIEGAVPKIKLARNNIATLNFLDLYGNPYPVTDVSPQSVENYFTAVRKGSDVNNNVGNIVELSGQAIAGSATISVLLAGRSTATPFEIEFTQDKNDIKKVIRLPVAAPGFEQVASQLPNSGSLLCKDDNLVEDVLAGLPPRSLTRLDINNPQFAAFHGSGSVYIRSGHEVISPSCDCLVYGPNSLNVCRIPESSTIIQYADGNSNDLKLVDLTTIIQ